MSLSEFHTFNTCAALMGRIVHGLGASRRCDKNELYMRTGMREALRQTIATEGNMHTHLAGRIGD